MIRITTLLSGHGVSALLTLARNLFLARLLGPDDYGIAITIVILIAGAELLTTLGLPQQIISNSRGATTSFQSTLHAIQLIRGVLGSILILICAAPLALAFDAEAHVTLFQAAALAPLILGFTHLDTARAQRQRAYFLHMMVMVVPTFIALLMVWPLTQLLSGPEVMLYLLILQSCITAAVSHAVALRKYSANLDSAIARQAIRFGLPLAANGGLMFMVLHVEKLLAGATLGLPELGLLAMGATLTMTPALILARSFQAYHLPKTRTQSAHYQVLLYGCLLGATLAVGLAVTIPSLVPLIAPQFADLIPLIAPLCCLAALRLPKSALATLALAQGRTHLAMLANIPRLLAAPFIWFRLSQGGTLMDLLLIALFSEVIGLILGLWMRRDERLPYGAFILGSLTIFAILHDQIIPAILMCIAAWISLVLKSFYSNASNPA